MVTPQMADIKTPKIKEVQPDLKKEQEKTLTTPTMKANLFLRMLYLGMDLIYGRGLPLIKFKSIEILARYPYQAWEMTSYHDLTRMYSRTGYTDKERSDYAMRIIELGRKSQDNEQFHMMIIEDIMRQKRMKQGWIKAYLFPRAIAFIYLGFTRALYRLKPSWSFAMNAKFESHAEHSYMRLVKEHPEWEDEPVETDYFEYYPKQKSMADLFRRIGLDERHHMQESKKEYEILAGKTLD